VRGEQPSPQNEWTTNFPTGRGGGGGLDKNLWGGGRHPGGVVLFWGVEEKIGETRSETGRG